MIIMISFIFHHLAFPDGLSTWCRCQGMPTRVGVPLKEGLVGDGATLIVRLGPKLRLLKADFDHKQG